MHKCQGEQSIRTLSLILGLVISVVQPLSSSLAQVTTAITPSGLNTQVSASTTLPNGQVNYDITGGTRPGNGPNLFHSFGDLSVGASNIANFLNNTSLPTTNILSRVTGGNPSNIFGTLQTTGFGNANLFLINPAGVVFGPTASLNVGGSVTVSTANYIKLADGVKFNAVPGASDALLSVASVTAFGFLGSTPGTGLAGTITVRPGTTLAVAPGQTLSLIGRDNVSHKAPHAGIEITGGTLSAPEGQINLVSVGKPSNQKNGGEVVVNGTGPSSGLVPTGFKSLGTITLTQGTSVDTSTGVSGAGARPAGGVSIRGGEFVMDASSITALNGNLSTGQAGNVEVTANTVTLSNQSNIQTGMAPCCAASSPGNITVNAETFSAMDSTISISTVGGVSQPYIPGAITIQGLDGAGSSARLVSLTNSNLAAFGGQDGFVGGPITIQAKDVVLNQSGLGAFSFDNVGGPISIVADRQIQSVGSSIGSNAFFGHGGAINMRAGAKIDLTNTTISASSSGGSTGGKIALSAPRISVSGGSIAAEHDFGQGGRGTVHIDAVDHVRLTDGARISADSPYGAGGNITINAGASFVSHNSTLSAQSAEGNGGTIHVQADQKIKLTNSELTTSVFGGPQSIAGRISLESKVVTLQNSQVLSKATEGQGGTINITATHRVVEDAASVISATSATGPNGSVTITAPVAILNGVVEP